MSTSVGFASKATADSYREDHGEYLCSDDDARKKTVVFASDVPDDVLERAELEALDERGESEAGAGQVQLTDAERDRIDFSAGRASVPHARSAKAIAADSGRTPSGGCPTR